MPKGEELQAIEKQYTVKARQPWWLVLCFAIVGMGFDWHCAFEWFSEKYPFCSGPVIRRMSLIVVLCATIAFLAVLVAKRKLRDAAAVFFFTSGTVLGNLLNWWWGGYR
jgi:hypothetical protein